VNGESRIVYIVTLLLAALAAVCTIVPSAEHRFLFRQDHKQYLVFSSNRVVIAGLGFLALAMCGCLLLVTTKLFGAAAGVVTEVAGAVPFAVLWFAVPLRRLRTLGGRRRDQ
jgi:branched-subunit amino acid ABC-type transport system permease component